MEWVFPYVSGFSFQGWIEFMRFQPFSFWGVDRTYVFPTLFFWGEFMRF
jgi:hypothetical protein